jgi:hypothetical protein
LLGCGRLCNADHTDRNATAGIACGLRLEVVFSSVYDDGTTENVVQVQPRRMDVDIGNSLLVGFHVAQVAGVMFVIARTSVSMTAGIIVSTRGSAGRIAAIAELMNVKAMGPRFQTRNDARDTRSLSLLLEADDASCGVALRGDEYGNRAGRQTELLVSCVRSLGGRSSILGLSDAREARECRQADQDGPA